MASPNTLTNTAVDLMGAQVLDAFTAKIAPIFAFATNFSADATDRGSAVQVLTIPATTAPITFVEGTGYTVQAGNFTGVDITLNKREFVYATLSTAEMRNNPQVALDRLATQKGFQLAKAFLQKASVGVWTAITNANFGAAAVSGIPTLFDVDDVATMRSAAQAADWPDDDRYLILNSALMTNLLINDGGQGVVTLVNASHAGSSAPLEDGTIKKLLGFQLIESTLIPANGENLIGFSANPNAIAVAMRVLVPDDISNIIRFQSFQHESGISIAFREWFDAGLDRRVAVWEVNYGWAVTNAAAIDRIVSA